MGNGAEKAATMAAAKQLFINEFSVLVRLQEFRAMGGRGKVGAMGNGAEKAATSFTMAEARQWQQRGNSLLMSVPCSSGIPRCIWSIAPETR
jgi:hypothetical protein